MTIIKMGCPGLRLALLGSVAFTSMVGLAAANAASPDHAQTAGSVPTLGEIIVTAQKREQRLQDVPLAVTAVTHETLQANRVLTVMDLTGLAPGLVAKANAGSLGAPSFAMRGVFATASASSADRQVSTYIDGVYLGSSRGGVFDLPDIERIEVLRGPQGTLFGRNATAGAVSVVTRNPTGQFHVRQELTYGNYDQFRNRTSVDLPAVGPFSAYVTYVHDEKRGDTRNLGAGTCFNRTSPFTNTGVTCSPTWLGSHNTNNAFVAVKFAPVDDFSMVYKFDYSNGTNTPEARATVAVNPNSLVGGLLSGVIATQTPGGGAFGPITFDPSNKRPDAVNNSWSQEGFIRASGHSLTTQWQINDSLSLKNITAYRSSTVYGPSTIAGLDGLEYTAATKAFYNTPLIPIPGVGTLSYAQLFGNGNLPVGSYFAGYEGNSYGKSWQASTETQLNYNSKLVTVTAGGIWYRANETDSGLPGMAPNFFFQPVPQVLPLGNVQVSSSTTTSIAAYAQAELHATSKLDFVFGGRVTQDKKYDIYTIGGTFVDASGGARTSGGIVGTTSFAGAFSLTKPTYSLGVNYKATPDTLIYGKYSTGFLSGGTVGAIAFAPETVGSWEGGVKSEWFDRRLRVNLALYDATYANAQESNSGSNVSIGGVTQSQYSVLVVNAGTLTAKGFELEVTAAPTRGLTFGGSLSYMDGKLLDPPASLAQGEPFVLSGAPAWTGDVNAQYETRPIFNNAYLYFRVDGNYVGQYRTIPNSNIGSPTQIPLFGPYQQAAGQWIINGRVALRRLKIAGADAEVALWARNLFDNKGPEYVLPFGDFQVDASYQPARTFGLDVNVDF